MIDPRARILLLFLGLAVLVLAINLVRKRQLQERYALLWLLAGLVLVLAPLFANGIDRLAAWLGFGYPPALLLMLAVIGLMLIIAQLSLSISSQADRIKVLTQELGLLRTEVIELKAKIQSNGSRDASPQPTPASGLRGASQTAQQDTLSSSYDADAVPERSGVEAAEASPGASKPEFFGADASLALHRDEP